MFYKPEWLDSENNISLYFPIIMAFQYSMMMMQNTGEIEKEHCFYRNSSLKSV